MAIILFLNELSKGPIKSLSKISFHIHFKKTGIKLELLQDPDTLLMFEAEIRGGIIQVVHRYAAANNKYMDNYNRKKPSSYIQYLNANNLYGWAMSQPLPSGGFKWVNVDPN